MSQTIEFEWMEDEGRHRVKVKTKKRGCLFYQEEEELVVSFSDLEQFDLIDFPNTARITRFVTWKEARITLGDVKELLELLDSMRESKIVRYRWVHRPQGRKVPYLINPRLLGTLYNAAYSLVLHGSLVRDDIRDMYITVQQRTKDKK
ncbi:MULTISPECIES: hypothetical protein [unclassified Psychrobacillus]|uniref:hypothetical protein n=1 Tax=unclassified Psychrobacillus TaxID=2636677 RepID=UPI0030F8E980